MMRREVLADRRPDRRAPRHWRGRSSPLDPAL